MRARLANGLSKAVCPDARCLIIVHLRGLCVLVCVFVCMSSKSCGGWEEDERVYWSPCWIALQQRQMPVVGGRGRLNVIGKKIEESGRVKDRPHGQVHWAFNPCQLLSWFYFTSTSLIFWQLTMWWIVCLKLMEVSMNPFPSPSPWISLCFYYQNSHLSGLVCTTAAVLKHPSLLCLSLPSPGRLFPSLCFLLKYMWRFSDSISVQALSPVRQRGFISPSPRRFPLFIARHHLLRDSSLCCCKRLHL